MTGSWPGKGLRGVDGGVMLAGATECCTRDCGAAQPAVRTIPEVVGPVVILPNFELRPNDAVAGYWWFVVILPNSSPLQQNRCHWEIDGIERGPDTPDPILLNASFGG